jgi:hypothetical protein
MGPGGSAAPRAMAGPEGAGAVGTPSAMVSVLPPTVNVAETAGPPVSPAAGRGTTPAGNSPLTVPVVAGSSGCVL